MRTWAVVENGAPLKEMEMPTPEPTGKQVLLEVTHCGVCHSDLTHLGRVLRHWRRQADVAGGPRRQTAAGHGPRDRRPRDQARARSIRVEVGDLRIVYPWVGCGHCERCLAEEDNMCLEGRSLGVFQNGGYATHVLADGAAAILIDPGSIDPALAATYACSGITVYSAIKKIMPLPPDSPIVLVGAGGLGLNAIAVLKAMGHRNIISVDISEEKRAVATAAGCDGHGGRVGRGGVRTDHRRGAWTGSGRDRPGERHSHGPIRIRALTKGGRMVQVGLFGGEITIALPIMAMREATIGGSYVGNPKELRELVALAQSGTLKPLAYSTVPMARRTMR